MKLLRLLVFNALLFLIFGCVQKPVVFKEFYAENIDEFIKKMQLYTEIESSLSLIYEGKNSVLNGDASLKISKNELLLRLYYMGFPAGELYEENGEVSSNLLIEKDRIKQITAGLRKGFMWWDGNFVVEEASDEYILKEKERERVVFLTKEGFIPLRQTLKIDNQNVVINYGNYQKIQVGDNLVLLPTEIVVNYKNRTLKMKIEQIKLKHG